jgi:aspartate-semialdehyde dehydrogenase
LKKTNIAILGATGMVGQRFITLLDNHPFFDVKILAASPASKGKKYSDAVSGRWKMENDIPDYAKDMLVNDVSDVEQIAHEVELVLCAIELDKKSIVEIEENYAKHEVVVVSNNSANRWAEDIPMLIPEINLKHLEIIDSQRKRLNTKKGFIVTKPNCSIQSYIPALDALREFEPELVMVSTYQAISGSGKKLNECEEIRENVIPYINGEEEKSEQEPLKIWGNIVDGHIEKADKPIISAQCLRVGVEDGHMATVSVKFKNKPTKEQILEKWNNYVSPIKKLNLPMSPEKFLIYMDEENRPQPKLDRDINKGMAISIGRLREDTIFDYKFVCLSHNTLRGAAGGSLLVAETLKALDYV